ncbi:MAG: LamG-like jellyroll fold domain-containing protein, partial [Kiritimatiellia bacterium]|nr:LamG-like jellyroll fold domain-containing protein [Kiritimatiellia bacterium]
FLPGCELQDVSGNNNVLTNAGVSFSAGTALFNGNHAVFRTLSALRLARHYNLTAECFLRVPTNIPSGSGMAVELSNNPLVRQGVFTLVGVKGSASGYPGAVESSFRNLSLYNSDRSANGAVTDGNWHHLAIVIDNRSFRSLRVRLYLDSALQSASEYNDDTYCAFRDDFLYIGSRGDSSLRLTGQLDDVRITAAALTPDQFLKERSRPKGTILRVF